MKKIDLVHTTVLIVAVLAGYSALEYIFYLLVSITEALDSSYLYTQSSGLFLHYCLLILLFAAASIILVRNGRKYAGLLLKDEPEDSGEDAAPTLTDFVIKKTAVRPDSES